MSWEDFLDSGAPSPFDEASDAEENEAKRKKGQDPWGFSEKDRALIRRVEREMRHEKPHYYVVFKSFLERGRLTEVKTDDGEWKFKVEWGFYADLSRKLGIRDNAVKKRLTGSLGWYADRLRLHRRNEDQP